jgi:OOP family OmpA-OmpF porin
MKQKLTLLAAGLLLAAPTVGAQRAVAVEAGVFAQYTRYDAFTELTHGIGGGGRLGVYPFKNFAIEYEGDFTRTTSARVGKLTAGNNRFDGIFYFPMSDKLRFLVGAGWTGTQYHSDTTLNQFDSGANAVVGFKYCFNDKWAMRTDVNADFKDPSDQTTSGQRTRTYNVRAGFSRFLGGAARNSPCYEAPPAPPAPPAPAPIPVPAPVAPAPAPAPVVVPAPAPPPAPVVTPPAAPARRALLTLRGTAFAFDKYNLTASAKDTLQQAVATLTSHPDANVEIQGHTDSVGSEKYNQALSERRANSVKAYLVAMGIAERRIKTVGFGELQPVADNKTAAGRAENRRVVIIEIP